MSAPTSDQKHYFTFTCGDIFKEYTIWLSVDSKSCCWFWTKCLHQFWASSAWYIGLVGYILHSYNSPCLRLIPSHCPVKAFLVIHNLALSILGFIVILLTLCSNYSANIKHQVHTLNIYVLRSPSTLSFSMYFLCFSLLYHFQRNYVSFQLWYNPSQFIFLL